MKRRISIAIALEILHCVQDDIKKDMRIDGKEIAQKILENLKIRVEKLKEKNITPGLSIILVGQNPASKAYVRQKELKANEIGAKAIVLNYESGIKNHELLELIKKLNSDKNVHGIIVQRPLPQHIDEEKIDLATNPKKDIDSFHPKSPYPMPLAAAVLKILEEIFYRGETATSAINTEFNNWLKSKKIVVIGKGQTGGGPTIQMLKKMGIQPQIIDSKTQNQIEITKTADIIISTVGKPNMIRPNMIKHGVILVSVGQHKGIDGKFHGDYEENEIKDIASFYTPTPGGIGPVNVAMLLENLISSTEN